MKTLLTSTTALCMLTLFSCGNAEKDHDTNTTKADTLAVKTEAAVVTEEAPPMDSAAMAKAWENYMMPGEMHKWMASQDGKWKGEMITWDGPNGSPSAPSEMTQENKMLMGGRYQESVAKGKMMGMDFEGHGLMAYDNAKKKFISTWIDNMGTGILVTEGTYNNADKSLSMTGTMTDPSTGKDTPVRQVYHDIDSKTQVMEMYCTMKGKEFKSMEIKMVKK